jgi:hypothetical protein
MPTATLQPRAICNRVVRLLGRLRRDERGISVVEFAISLPLFSALAMYGLEIAYMATVNLQVSQMALSVADNASRLGQTDNSAVPPTVNEADVVAVLGGSLEQGSRLKFKENGRIILTSLEKDAGSGKQYIHWQRCTGDLTGKTSSYGNDTTNNGLSGAPLTGMGLPTKQVTANTGQAVMYAEVYYKYQPLFGRLFVNQMTMKQEAAYIVRDDRNLAGGGGAGITGTKKSTC